MLTARRRPGGWPAVRNAALVGFLSFSILPGTGIAAESVERVVFQDGRALLVTGHRAAGDRVTLVLEGGGEITVPRDRIRSIRALPPVLTPAESGPAPPASETGPVDRAGAAAGRAAADAGTLFDQIARLALQYGLDTQLVAAVALVESGFDPGAESPKGAIGLMQLMPGTAADYGVTDRHDPAQNLEAGIAHLKRLVDRYQGDLRLALAAYNAGEGTVARFGGIPPYPETVRYVDRVLALARVD